MATVVVVVAVLAGCGNDDLVQALRGEPILDQPPGGVELAVSEVAGSDVGFETPARVEVIWGIEDRAAAADWYLTQFGAGYDLDLNEQDQWLGGRQADGVRVNVSVRTLAGLADAKWDSMVTEQGEVAAWDGPMVVVRASAG